jgi:hypothetical protein
MKQSQLVITYRKGRFLAAYFHLPRQEGDASARTEELAGGLLVDFAADGRPIGVEILSPEEVDLPRLNELLVREGLEPLTAEDLEPLTAA